MQCCFYFQRNHLEGVTQDETTKKKNQQNMMDHHLELVKALSGIYDLRYEINYTLSRFYSLEMKMHGGQTGQSDP